MKYWRFFMISLALTYRFYWRYPVEWLTNWIGGVVLLGGILLGGKAALGINMADQSASLLFGFIAITALQAPLKYLDGRIGEIEELYLYPFPAVMVLLLWGIASSLTMYLNLTVLYGTLCLFLGIPLSGLFLIAYYTIPVFVGLSGLGLILAGAQLIVKRLGSLPNLVSLLLITSAFSPSTALQSIGRYLPLVQAFAGVQGRAVNQTTLWLGSLLLGALGLLVFQLCQRRVVKYGLASSK